MILVTPPSTLHGEFGHGISASLNYPASTSSINTDITLHNIPALINYPYLPNSAPPPTREISLWAGTTERGLAHPSVEYEGVLVTSVGNSTTYKIWWASLAGTNPSSTMTVYSTPNPVKAGDTLEFITTPNAVKNKNLYTFTLTVKDDTRHWSANYTTPIIAAGHLKTTAQLGMTPVQLPTNDSKFEFTQNVNFSVSPAPTTAGVSPYYPEPPYTITDNNSAHNSFSLVPYTYPTH